MTASPAPADGWRPTGDALLRGLAHELSNRIGTIGAAAEALAASDPASRLAPLLAGEARRLEELLRLLRLLPDDPSLPPEPVRPADLLADAAALFALHARGRDARVAVADAETAPPVRVRVAETVRRLVALLEGAAGSAPAPAIHVRCAGDDDTLRLEVDGPGDRASLALPTLAGLRRQERG